MIGVLVISELKEGRPESEIQKQDEDTETSIEFMVIWRRANRNPMEVLRIIERENSGHRMRHWANAVRMVQDRKV